MNAFNYSNLFYSTEKLKKLTSNAQGIFKNTQSENNLKQTGIFSHQEQYIELLYRVSDFNGNHQLFEDWKYKIEQSNEKQHNVFAVTDKFMIKKKSRKMKNYL